MTFAKMIDMTDNYLESGVPRVLYMIPKRPEHHNMIHDRSLNDFYKIQAKF